MLRLGEQVCEELVSDASAPTPAAVLTSWLSQTASGDDLHPRLLRLSDGRVLPLPVARWAGRVDAVDLAMLDRVTGPVLDIGCGPGRLTAALHERGYDVLGVELVPAIPVLALQAGAPVLVADVFAPLPRAGRWRCILLADGNVGIGGDATRMLHRVVELLAPGGAVLVELHPGADVPVGPVRLEGLGVCSQWFGWNLLGALELPAVAARVGLSIHDTWNSGGREFAELRHL